MTEPKRKLDWFERVIFAVLALPVGVLGCALTVLTAAVVLIFMPYVALKMAITGRADARPVNIAVNEHKITI